uniref:Uncharacterized protein n=1 Tax=Oryza rufipogon TaxID=4529 RepID=A0A0E0PQN3_ORYRU
MATVSPGLFSYYDPIPIGRSRCADQKGPTHFAGPPPGPARRAAVKSSCAAGLAAPLPRRAPVHVAAVFVTHMHKDKSLIINKHRNFFFGIRKMITHLYMIKRNKIYIDDKKRGEAWEEKRERKR